MIPLVAEIMLNINTSRFIRHVSENEINLKANKLHIIKTTKQEEKQSKQISLKKNSKQKSYDPLDVRENEGTERNETRM